MLATTHVPADYTRPSDRLTEPGTVLVVEYHARMWRPRPPFAPRLVSRCWFCLDQFITIEHTRASGDRLRECPKMDCAPTRARRAIHRDGRAMLSVHMTDGPIRSAEDAERELERCATSSTSTSWRAASASPRVARSRCRSSSKFHELPPGRTTRPRPDAPLAFGGTASTNPFRTADVPALGRRFGDAGDG